MRAFEFFSRLWATAAALELVAGHTASYPDTGIVIVSNNDLDPANTQRASALYLSRAFTCAEAQLACQQLQESLLPAPNGTGLTAANLSAALTSDKHGVGIDGSQKIWILGEGGCGIFTPNSANSSSKSHTTSGGLNFLQTLPVLCTNSATPTRSNSTDQDTSRQVDVTTNAAGTLTGFRDRFTFKFLGIKFAEPPANESRFQAPIPLTVPNGTKRSALVYGTMCPQPPDADNGHVLYTNEDCLQLNVFSPVVNPQQNRSSTTARLPVMFFIHGGGLNTGDSGPFPYNMTTSGFVGESVSNLYDGTNLVSYGGVVLVMINYRLNALGWFNASNAALKDTLLALNWVQDNIEAFGGDPTKVTLFGESAGGIIIRYLLQTNRKYTQGLFAGAILESDFPQLSISTPPELSFNTSLKLAQAVGCASNFTTAFNSVIADCVRHLPAGDIVMASYNLGLSWGAVVDGDYILTDIVTDIASGTSAQVPTIWASNQCEYCYFLPDSIANASADTFPVLLGSIFSDSTTVDAIINATDIYPYQTAAPEGDLSGPAFIFGLFVTDYAVHCPMAYLSSLENNSTNQPSYKVEFAAGLGSPLTPNPVACVDQVCHGDELYWVFSTAEIDNLYLPLTASQLEITRDVVTRWTTFARTGSPNYEDATLEWPVYKGDNEVVVSNQTSIQASREAQCNFLRSQIGFTFGLS